MTCCGLRLGEETALGWGSGRGGAGWGAAVVDEGDVRLEESAV